MADEAPLHPISCTNCRFRKVRCTRRLPQCERCTECGVTCVYPPRAPKKHAAPTANHRLTALETTLADVVRRLDRVEGGYSCHGHLEDIAKPTPAPNEPDVNRLQDHPSTEPQLLRNDKHIDPYTSMMDQAVDQIRIHVKRKHNSSHEIPSKPHLPSQVAKSWIEAYFAHLPEDLAPAMLNVKLIKMMPDLIGLSNVHLDDGILVVYYCILYHGCLLQRKTMSVSDYTSRLDNLYDQCLDAVASWRHRAAATFADLNAAFFMVRVAADRFDMDLSWHMFRMAARIAEQMGLGRIDGHSVAQPPISNDVLDASRKCFWELISMDLYFHFTQNKPLNMQDHWEGAVVNLPWMSGIDSPGAADLITTTRFLLDCRRSFVLMKFSRLLSNASLQHVPDLFSQTEALCAEIEALYEKWSIEDMVQSMLDSGGQIWTVAGLAIEGHACVLSMLGRLLEVTKLLPESSLSEQDGQDACDVLPSRRARIARRIIKLTNLLLAALPCLSTIAVVFDVLQVHVALGCLASHLIRTEDSGIERQDNIASIEHTATLLGQIAAENEEVAPLTVALSSVVRDVQSQSWPIPSSSSLSR